jgi:hypothetical protein
MVTLLMGKATTVSILTRRTQLIRGWRLTEDASLHGLAIRDRGEWAEFISYEEATRRLTLAALKRAQPAAAEDRGGREAAGDGRTEHASVL